MNIHFPLRRVQRAGVWMLVLLAAAACSGALPDASWGSMTALGNPSRIVVAFNDRVVMLDPLNGTPLNLDQSRAVDFALPTPEATTEPEAAATAEATAEAPAADAAPVIEPTIAVDAQGQIPNWEVRGGEQSATHFYSAPIQLDNETLLVAAYENRLYEIRLQTGSRLSTTTLPGHVIGQMLLADGLLYIPLSDGDLLALMRQPNGTWTEVWRLNTDHGIYSTPLLLDGVLYVSSLDHVLYALDPQTGAEQWQLNLGGALADTPVAYNGDLYIGSFGRRIFRVSMSGELLDQYETRDWVWGSPTIVDGVLYAADLAGWVYALNLSDGAGFTPLWEPRQVAGRGIRATPLVSENRIIVGSRDRNVYWLDRATGQEILRREVRGEVLGDLQLLQPSDSLRIGEPLVLVTTMAHDQVVTAFTLNEGISRWSYGR